MHCLCVILSSVACRAVQYFYTLSSKQHAFQNKVIGKDVCIDFLCNTNLKHFFVQKGILVLMCPVAIILVRF
jgi:hypothetical protein